MNLFCIFVSKPDQSKSTKRPANDANSEKDSTSDAKQRYDRESEYVPKRNAEIGPIYFI